MVSRGRHVVVLDRPGLLHLLDLDGRLVHRQQPARPAQVLDSAAPGRVHVIVRGELVALAVR